MRELRRLLSYLGPYRRDMFIGGLLVFVETVFELVIPVLMADLIDVGVEHRDLHYIVGKGLQMGLCALLALVTGLLYARFAARAAYGWGARVREAQYEKVQSYAFSNLDRFETGSLVTRMTTDVTVLQNAVNGGLRPLVRSPVMLVMGLGLSFWMNAELALIFVVCAPILALILFLVVSRVAPMYSRLQKAVDRLNNVVQEGLTAIRAVKAFVRGEYEEDKFQSVNQELMETSQRTFHLAVLNLPAFQFTMYTAIVLILWFGGGMILEGGLQVGELTGFLSYVLQVMNSFMMISNVFLLLTRSLASAHRIAEVLDEDIVLTSPEDPIRVVPDGSVDYQGVSFKYHDDAKAYALSGVDLHIKAGQTVGILGGTGSAKTTLVQLIPRLYDVTRGSVKVGGHDVREYDLTALRDAVGIVLQKNVLFSGTVRENLQWGDREADDETLWAACRAACADEFLEKMPGGLDADLGQGGVNVSGGQKQRLCIARALLKKPKILIFDDSTSAVDTATEEKIRSALAGLTGVTKIIIAQRVTSVMHTDLIVILEDGRVHATGTHAQLLASDPIYQEIYASQMKGGEDHGGPAAQRQEA
ncbi:ABC transporter ATP-binding protein [Intestinimonas butyriciproducens]|uniref:ABC transporter ATP-binding protein n=1 Tax=Intestinimonas butyriciproducens TaxID=1297617 RepID=UPI00195AF5EB|nr:ABC transporter ATP-binding protein [Intestinimonas butyriciproducens]MBM6976296.1 ABC transporter ATP-binding protein [Intestinimonas butyriciproducens]